MKVIPTRHPNAYCVRMLALLWAILGTLTLQAEGVKQVAPNPDDMVMLLVDHPNFGNFASYGAPDNNRLYFQLDQADEVLYIGLSREYTGAGVPQSTGGYSFRIRRVSDNAVVHGPYNINNNNENLTSWAQAAAGPAAMTAGGYETNDDRYRFEPGEAGLYYIEFNGVRHIGFWDFTVAQNGQEVPGRVYSKNWAFRTPADVNEQPECVWDRDFNGSLYSYTSDGFVTRINFQNSGFQGLSFNVAFNRTGPGDSGDFQLDRMSIPGSNATDNAAEHLIFLAEPDPVLFPDGECGSVSVAEFLSCDDGGYCLETTVTQPGQVEIVLDFNGNDVYDPDTDQRLLHVFSAGEPLTACLEWDGLQADGNPVPSDADIKIMLQYTQGVQHWALFDAEFLKNGFCVETIRPACAQSNDPNLLYWDDRNIPEAPGTNAPKDGRLGCDCETDDDCRTFTNFAGNQPNCNSINDDLTEGYGDKSTLNTWWFARNSETANITIPLTGVIIEGPEEVCNGDNALLSVIWQTNSDIIIVDWFGPNGNLIASGGSGLTSLTVNDPGNYMVRITDEFGCVFEDNYTLTSVVCPADLELEKSVNIISPSVGQVITYGITLVNKGPGVAFGVEVTDILPDVLSDITNISHGGVYSNGQIIWSNLEIQPNQFLVLTYQATFGVGFDYTNYAEITAAGPDDPDSTPGNGIDTDGDGDCSDDDGDEDDGDCVTLEPQPCEISVAVSDPICNPAGTVIDPNDDTYTFTVTVTGDNVSDSWVANDPAGTTGNYGEPVTFGPYDIADGDVSFDIQDSFYGEDCITSVSVTAPETCSDQCLIELSLVDTTCDPNGTLSDGADDLFFVTINVDGYNSSVNGWVTNTGHSGAYGQQVVLGPFDISEGDFDLVFVDAEDNNCFASLPITAPDPCSNQCVITDISYSNVTCDPNGTNVDPEDDVFTFDLVVTGLNTSGTWTSNNVTGTYGEPTQFGPFPIADGPVIIVITDANDPNCSSSVTVDPPAETCSDQCAFKVELTNIKCQDNGTDYLIGDDQFTYELTVSSINATSSGWITSNGDIAQYGQTLELGPFDIGDGQPFTITVSDAMDPNCSEEVVITPPEPCSPVCFIDYSGISNILCDDNGTDTDPSDDVFTFEVMLEGFNTSGTWEASNGESGNFGENHVFGPFLISEGAVSIDLWDTADPDCFRPIVVTPPAPCSDRCLIDVEVISVDCEDGGTNYDDQDDVFYYTVRVDGLNATSGGWQNSEGEIGQYGVEYTYGPFLIADGPVEFDVEDILGGGECKVVRSIAPPAPCSPVCFIQAEIVAIDCDENDTQFFVEDDLLYYSIVVNGFNTTNGWETNDGTVGDYGQVTLSQPRSLTAENLTVEVWDALAPGCVTQVEIELPELEVFCPENADTRTVEANVQILEGQLNNNDNVWDDIDSLCWLPTAFFEPGDHYYELLRFRLPETANEQELYTFFLFSDIASTDGNPMMDGAGALFIGDYYEDDPCCFMQSYPQRRPTMEDDFMENPTFETDGVVSANMVVTRKFTMLLTKGQVYNLATTTWSANATGSFAWVAISQADDPLDILGTNSFGEFIKNYPVQYRLFQNDADTYIDAPESLPLFGEPSLSSYCGVESMNFSDAIIDLDDCEDIILERTFQIHGLNDIQTCVQQITLARPSLEDIVMPPSTYLYNCGDDIPDLSQGFPDPSVTGQPFIYTTNGLEVLEIGINGNIIVTFKDQVTVNNGTNWQLERSWTIIDQCQVDTIGQFLQQIKAGLGGSIALECPVSNHYCPIVEEDIMLFNTDPFECTATIEAPLPNIISDCFSDNVEILTEILQEQNGMFVILHTIPFNADDRTVPPLALGDYYFRYTATAPDLEPVELLCRFRVADLQEPVAICGGNINLSLNNLGGERLFVGQIDAGSYDNCEVASMEIRRNYFRDPVTCDTLLENTWSDWGMYVDFTCCDANDVIMVELRITDQEGNENFCWVNVLVEDKVLPICTGLVDQNLSCEDLPIEFDLSDTTMLQEYFGVPQVLDNCVAYAVELAPIVDLSGCGMTGTVTRRFVAIDQVGNTSMDVFTQVITVDGSSQDYGIFFPADLETDCTDDFNTLQIIRQGCDMFEVTYEDEFMDVEGDECYYIARTWSVVNLCEFVEGNPSVEISRDENCNGTEGEEGVWVISQPNTAFVDRDSLPLNGLPTAGTKGTSCDGSSNPSGHWREVVSTGSWRYVQMIRIFDTTPPVVIVDDPDAFITDGALCEGEVNISFQIDESCISEGLTVSLALDANNDGTVDGDLTESALSGEYPNYEINGNFPIGDHRFIVAATDNCGNTGFKDILFTVADGYVPEPTCYSGLIVNLATLPPGTDVDGDGIADPAAAFVQADQLASCGELDCSGLLRFSVNRMGEIANPDQTEIALTCDDRYQVDLEVYVWDMANNPYSIQPDGTVGGPNYRYCEARVYVQDPDLVCPSCEDNLRVDGDIMSMSGQALGDVNVTLSGTNSANATSSDSGVYGFGYLTMGGTYEVHPHKDGGDVEGVTTLDLLAVYRHILGVDIITDPYLLLAADVNNSGSVTTQDMIVIQQLIKGDIGEWPSLDSWMFVDAEYTFENPTNPWGEDYPTYTVHEDIFTCLSADFVGIKIGDINRSWTENLSDNTVAPRTTWGLYTPEQEVRASTEINVPIYAEDLSEIEGFQFTLSLDPDRWTIIEVIPGLIPNTALGHRLRPEGLLTVSHASVLNAADHREPLFTLVLEAHDDLWLSQDLSLGSYFTAAEAYTSDLQTLLPSLGFTEQDLAQVAEVRLEQNYPNPFQEATTIWYYLPEANDISLRVYDLSGKQIYHYQGNQPAGLQSHELRNQNWPAGIYIYSLEVDGQILNRRMAID